MSGCSAVLGLDKYEVLDDTDGSNLAGSNSTDPASGGRDPDPKPNSGGATSSGGAQASGGRESSGGASHSGGATTEPECTDNQPGSKPDEGCSKSAPFCDAGECVECERDEDCADKHECSLDACVAGRCERSYDDSLCTPVGGPCARATCGENGCTSSEEVGKVDLLMGSGSFENSAQWTSEPGSSATFVAPGLGGGAPVDGVQVLRMTDNAGQFGSVLQRIALPKGTISLTVSGNYRSVGMENNRLNDWLFVGFWDKVLYGAAVDTRSDEFAANAPSWTTFTREYELDDLQFVDSPNVVEFNIYAETNLGIGSRSYALDAVSVTALICVE